MNENNENKYIRWTEKSVWLCEQNGIIVTKLPSLSQEKSVSVRLNSEGKSIWDHCDGTKKINDIVDHLYRLYDVTRPFIREECEKIIFQGLEHQLLELNDESLLFDLFPFNIKHYIKWNENIVWRKEEDNLLLIDMTSSNISIFPLEPYLDIWQLFDGNQTIETILNHEKEISKATLRYFHNFNLISIYSSKNNIHKNKGTKNE